MKRFFVVIMLFAFVIPFAHSHEVSKKAKVFIKSPQNGANVTSPVTIEFGIKGYLIAPVGENIHKAGHYHLLIDLQNDLDLDEPIPRDAQHLHFDKGETQTVLALSPGQHTLQLVLGDEEHEPFEELISEQVVIHVK